MLMTMIAYAFLQHSPPSNSKAGKKESTGHRPSRFCQACATPSSNSSLDHHRSDVRIAENGFATSGSVSKSAKVVVARMANGDHSRSGMISRAARVHLGGGPAARQLRPRSAGSRSYANTLLRRRSDRGHDDQRDCRDQKDCGQVPRGQTERAFQAALNRKNRPGLLNVYGGVRRQRRSLDVCT